LHVPVRLHHDRQHARPHRLRSRGRRRHPGRGPPAGGAHHHAADGAARDSERLHPGRAAGPGPLRLPGDPGPARGLPHRDHPDVVVLPVPAPRRAGRRVLDPAPARDRAPAARPEKAARAARLRRGRRQGRAAAHHPARPLAASRARGVPGRAGRRGVPALRHPAQGRVRARLGPTAHPRELHPENWSFTFLHSATQSAIVNTLELGVLTACVGAGLATVLAYVTNRRLVAGHQVLGFLAVAPVVIPGVVLAVALFVAYTRPPFLLYGTLWILFIAYLT